jgi:predicted MFS family arabinose efflux permease
VVPIGPDENAPERRPGRAQHCSGVPKHALGRLSPQPTAPGRPAARARSRTRYAVGRENILELAAFRFVQGLGGGLMTMSQTIIADVVPVKDRAKYTAPMGAVYGLASVVGPLVGGWLTDGPGRRWAFWVNLPLGLAALIVLARTVHLPRRRDGHAIDHLGLALVSAAASCLVLARTGGGSTYAWTSPVVVGPGLATVALSAGFVAAELRAPEPLIPLRLFRHRNVWTTTLVGFVLGLGTFASIGYLPTYLQTAYSVSATASGLLLLTPVVGILITSTASAQVISAGGSYRAFPVAGSVVIACAPGLLPTLTVSPLWAVCAHLLVLGGGFGLVMQVLVLIVQNAVAPEETGTATSTNDFFRELGATLGMAVVGGLFSNRLADRPAHVLPAGSAGSAGSDVSASSLAPAVVNALPPSIHDGIVSAYADREPHPPVRRRRSARPAHPRGSPDHPDARRGSPGRAVRYLG